MPSAFYLDCGFSVKGCTSGFTRQTQSMIMTSLIIIASHLCLVSEDIRAAIIEQPSGQCHVLSICKPHDQGADNLQYHLLVQDLSWRL